MLWAGCALSLLLLPRAIQAGARKAPSPEGIPVSSDSQGARAFDGPGQEAGRADVLEPGATVERAIQGGQTHTFKVMLGAGQYARFVAEQRGIDIILSILPAKVPQPPPGDGARCPSSSLVMDNLTALYGPESASVEAQSSSEYRLTVCAPDAGAAPGGYALHMEGARQPSPEDSQRWAAEAALVEAEVLRRKNDLAAAAAKYQATLPLWHSFGDEDKEATTLLLLANALNSQGLSAKLSEDEKKANLSEPEKKKALYDQAFANYARALALRQKMGDAYWVAVTRNEMGYAAALRRDLKEAEAQFEEALRVAEGGSFTQEQCRTFYLKGFSYLMSSNPGEALKAFGKALDISRAEHIRSREAGTLSAMGGAYENASEFYKALESYRQSAAIWQELGEEKRYATVLNNMAVTHDSLGEWNEALGEYTATLRIYDDARSRCRSQGSVDRKDCGNVVKFLRNVGMFYIPLGEAATGLRYLEEAGEIQRASGVNDQRELGTTLLDIGFAYDRQGDAQRAKSYYVDALALLGKTLDYRGQSYALTLLGMAYAATGEPATAFGHYEKALAVWLEKAPDDLQGRAFTLDKMGRGHALAGNPSQALKTLGEALQLWQKTGDRRSQAETLYGLGLAARQLGNPTEAAARAEAALGIVESVRMRGASSNLRSSYLSEKHDYYELAIDMRMRLHALDPTAGHDRAALRIYEQSRARSLLETLGEAGADIASSAPRELVERRRDLKRQLNEAELALMRLRDAGPAAEGRVAQAQKRVGELTDELDRAEARLRESSPGYAALTRHDPLGLTEIQQLLDDDTLLLEYSLGKERSHVWVVSRAGFTSEQLKGQAEIEQLARCVRSGMSARKPRAEAGCRPATFGDWPDADDLSRALLWPVAAHLGNKRLLIVADGGLEYIPFGVLPAPPRPETLTTKGLAQGVAGAPALPHAPLLAGHEIASLPSASTLAALRHISLQRRRAPKSVAVFADPVFEADDSRLLSTGRGGPTPASVGAGRADGVPAGRDKGEPEGGGGFGRLQSSLREGKEIMRLAPAGSGMMATAFEANLALATSGQMSQYRIIHFATHGVLDTRHPGLSSIVLSLFDRKGGRQDGFLRLHNIYDMRLSADLVVLSACDTALGKSLRGEGLIGLTRGFMHAGVPRVVASLWKADDEATTELMTHFYQHLLQKGESPATALRQAQLEMWRQSQWQSPYFWGGFVLQGLLN
ncbi:MAG: CHAT domain-containing protein [Acidobacteria bacterium]|nr:CHAT domain-containing protein [Acidobacteriota bacterium]